MTDTIKEGYGFQFKDSDKRNAGHLRGAYHIASEKSKDDLQTHIDPTAHKVKMEQFRANIIVKGVEPWEEDDVREFTIEGQEVKFRNVLSTKRCKITNYEIPNAKWNKMGEPLNTLNKLRYAKGIGPVFGFFAQPDSECEIKVGDKIRYTKKTATPMSYA